MSNIEKAARIVGKTMSRWDMDGRPDIPGGIDTHITEALADAGLLMPEDEEPAGLRCEYRVIHPTPRTMAPTPPMDSEAEAEKVIESARHILGNDLADQLTIQRRLIGEWEEI